MKYTVKTAVGRVIRSTVRLAGDAFWALAMGYAPADQTPFQARHDERADYLEWGRLRAWRVDRGLLSEQWSECARPRR